MEKAHLVAQPFQLIAQQRREAYQLSGSGGRDNESGYADEGDAIPPVGRSPIAPLSRQGVPLGYSPVSKKRERH